jgi:hypothetical protein
MPLQYNIVTIERRVQYALTSMYNRKSRNKKIEMTTKTSKQVEIKLTSLLSFRRAVEARGLSFSKSLLSFPKLVRRSLSACPRRRMPTPQWMMTAPQKVANLRTPGHGKTKQQQLFLLTRLKLTTRKTLSIYLSRGTGSEV